MSRHISSRVLTEHAVLDFWSDWAETRVQTTQSTKSAYTVHINICFTFALCLAAQSWRPEIVAEQVWFGVFGGRMIAFENQLMVFQSCSLK